VTFRPISYYRLKQLYRFSVRAEQMGLKTLSISLRKGVEYLCERRYDNAYEILTHAANNLCQDIMVEQCYMPSDTSFALECHTKIKTFIKDFASVENTTTKNGRQRVTQRPSVRARK